MGIVNKTKHIDDLGEPINIGQYTYVIKSSSVDRPVNGLEKRKRALTHYSASVKINREYIKEHGFNPDELPLSKVNKVRVEKFGRLFDGLGYEHLVRFNSSLYDWSINTYDLTHGLQCDIFDIRGSNAGICNNFFYGYRCTCKVLIMDFKTFKDCYELNENGFLNMINVRQIWSDTEDKIKEIESILYDVNRKTMNMNGNYMLYNKTTVMDVDYIDTFLTKMELLEEDIRAIMVV